MPITQSGLFIPPAGPHRPFRNPVRGLTAPDGRRYEECPMCSAVASLRKEQPDGDIEWACERCGYKDSLKHGALN